MSMKKIVAGLAAVSMLAAVSAQMAFAADAVSLTGDKATATAGSEFTLSFKLKGVPKAGINAAEFALKYDEKALTITGIEAGKIVNTEATSKEGLEGLTVFSTDTSKAGTANVTYAVALDDSAYWVTTDGVFLTVTGTVNEGTKDGTYPVDVTPIDRETHDGSGENVGAIYVGNMSGDKVTTYDVTTTAGSVVVGKADDTKPTEPKPTDQNPTEDTTGAGSSGDTKVKKGDADCNGTVDILDVIFMNRSILGKATLNDQQFKNADLDEDGTITPGETLDVMKYIVKIITEL